MLMSVLNLNKTGDVCAEAWNCAVITASDKGIKAVCANRQQGRV